MDQFTPGQAVVMQQAWETYRHKLGFSEQVSIAADGFSCIMPTLPPTSKPTPRPPTSQPTPTSPISKPTPKPLTASPTRNPTSKPTKKRKA